MSATHTTPVVFWRLPPVTPQEASAIRAAITDVARKGRIEMPTGELAINVRVRWTWYCWLLWPLVKWRLLLSVWFGRLSGAQARKAGERYLVQSLWMQVDGRSRERLRAR